MLTIYTDGSCLNNGQPNAIAGWAFYSIEDKKKECGLVQKDEKQTNNTGELMGIKKAIEHAISQEQDSCLIFSDSRYCIDSLTIWNIEKKKKGEPKKNYDLIKSILYLHDIIDVSYEWVRGHADDYYNNVVDEMANGIVMQTLIPNVKRI